MPPDPIAALRRLAALAGQAGANPRDVQACVDAIFGSLLAVDRRRLEAQQLRERIRQADAAYRAAGTEARIEKLAVRFNRSRATVYALLKSAR